jgi:hypothetical protein
LTVSGHPPPDAAGCPARFENVCPPKLRCLEPLRILRLPAPVVCTHPFDAEFHLPARQLRRRGRIGIARRHIVRPPRRIRQMCKSIIDDGRWTLIKPPLPGPTRVNHSSSVSLPARSSALCSNLSCGRIDWRYRSCSRSRPWPQSRELAPSSLSDPVCRARR